MPAAGAGMFTCRIELNSDPNRCFLKKVLPRNTKGSGSLRMAVALRKGPTTSIAMAVKRGVNFSSPTLRGRVGKNGWQEERKKTQKLAVSERNETRGALVLTICR